MGRAGRSTPRRALVVLALLVAGPAAAAPQDAPPPAPAPAPAPAAAPPAPRPPAAKLNSVFQQRTAPRDKVFRETGSTTHGPESEKALAAGLRWLVRHQNAQGFWDADGFFQNCRGTVCDGQGGPLFDPALTGLAVLALLGSGVTPRDPGELGDAVRKGLAHLEKIQDADGCVGPRTSNHFTYNHAIAGLALAEGHALARTTELRDPAQRAVQFSVACQNPYLGWRYGVRPGDNDTSVTGWMTLHLKVAEWAGLRVPPTAFQGAVDWLDRVTDPVHGRAGYTARGNGPARPQELLEKFPADHSESLTAIAVETRMLCGAPATHPMVAKGCALLRAVLPKTAPPSFADHYYWYWGSLASFQAGGETWRWWQDAMVKTALATQRKDEKDCRAGSWDPVDPWAADGGRVYSTAVHALCLEAPYRYARFSTTPPDRTRLNLETDPPGARVVIDGIFLGTTPLREVAVPAGPSTVRLLHPGASDTTLSVDLAPLETNEGGAVNMPSGAVVDLSAVPGSISVIHEGRRLTGAAAPVRPGKVRFVAFQPKCRTRVTVIEAKKGDRITFDATPLEKVNDWSRAAVRNLPAPPAWTGPVPAQGLGIHEYEGRFYCEKDGSEMVVIPGFVPQDEKTPPSPPFLVDRHEVTLAQYRKFCTETKRKPPKQPAGVSDDHPVVGVTCKEAGEYAAWAGKRLPTPAEWYRAAAGDLPAEFGLEAPFSPWGQFDSPEARIIPEGEKIAPRPEKVGSFPAGMSPCGAFDMVGNAFEWCAPLVHDKKPYWFHLRGASWMDGRWSRDSGADEAAPDTGFRCARDM